VCVAPRSTLFTIVPTPAPVTIAAYTYITSNTTYSISNNGTEPLSISAALLDHSGTVIDTSSASTSLFRMAVGSSNLLPEQSTSVTVHYTPNTISASEQVTLVLHIANSSAISVQLNYVVTQSLDIPAQPSETRSVQAGSSFTTTITFTNKSPTQLQIDLTIVSGNSTTTTTNSTMAQRSITQDSASNVISIPNTLIAALQPASLTLPGASPPVSATLTVIGYLPFYQTINVRVRSQFMSNAAPVLLVGWNSLAGLVRIDQSTINLGSVAVGASVQGSVLLSNTGNSPLTILSFGEAATIPSPWLTIDTPPSSVAAQDQVHLTARCTPSAAGTYNSELLLLVRNAPATPETYIHIKCTATATCFDGYKNQDETGIDCGGLVCPLCSSTPPPLPPPPPPPPMPTPIPPDVIAAPTTPSTNGSTTSTTADRPTVASAPASTPGATTPTTAPPIANLPATNLAPMAVVPSVTPLTSGNSNNQPVTVTVTSASGQTLATVAIAQSSNAPVALVVGAADQQAVDKAITASGNVQLGSVALEVSLTDGSTQLTQPATLCFTSDKSTDYGSACLGYINKDGVWACQDKCLDQSKSTLICGKTDHFTSFAVLLSGGEYGCDTFITGTWQGDFALAASVFGAVWCVACVACVAYFFDSPYRRCMRNELDTAVHTRKRRERAQSEMSISMNASDYYA
jgi:hypothetical protein